jgi:N-acetyl-alpha-D-muramate 1-phosphate uridylyltransferase
MRLPVIILAGGLATRLNPETITTPKSMIIVAGKPFIEHQISMLKRWGATEFLLCIGHLGDQIREFVGDGSKWGVSVSYSVEKKSRGTGGALKNAESMLPPEFMVVYGDTYPYIDLEPVVRKYYNGRAWSLMTISRGYKNNNVGIDFEKVTRYDKSADNLDYIDWGVSILRKKILSGFSKDEPFDLSEIFNEVIQKRKLSYYIMPARFYEVGTREGIRETEEFMDKQVFTHVY